MKYLHLNFHRHRKQKCGNGEKNRKEERKTSFPRNNGRVPRKVPLYFRQGSKVVGGSTWLLELTPRETNIIVRRSDVKKEG